jgi:virulence-associated protein VapD
MGTGRKQVAFDLDTKALEMYYPAKSWEHAYDDIKRHMKANDFEWIQGSVYVSARPVTAVSTSNLLLVLIQKYPWLNVCMRDCVITNIGKLYSQNYLFDKSAAIAPRSCLK